MPQVNDRASGTALAPGGLDRRWNLKQGVWQVRPGRTTYCHAHADMAGAHQTPCRDACLLCCALPSCLQFQASPQLAITFVDTPPFIREYHEKHWANLVGGWCGLPFLHSVLPAWMLRHAHPAAYMVAPHAACGSSSSTGSLFNNVMVLAGGIAARGTQLVRQQQVALLKEVLKNSSTSVNLVVGHHPVGTPGGFWFHLPQRVVRVLLRLGVVLFTHAAAWDNAGAVKRKQVPRQGQGQGGVRGHRHLAGPRYEGAQGL